VGAYLMNLSIEFYGGPLSPSHIKSSLELSFYWPGASMIMTNSAPIFDPLVVLDPDKQPLLTYQTIGWSRYICQSDNIQVIVYIRLQSSKPVMRVIDEYININDEQK
jgi:hypothetical protein